MVSGAAIIDLCKTHVIETMSHMAECAPGAPGAGWKKLERACDFELSLTRMDGYFTWSLLVALANEGRIEVVAGEGRNKKYRLPTP